MFVMNSTLVLVVTWQDLEKVKRHELPSKWNPLYLVLNIVSLHVVLTGVFLIYYLNLIFLNYVWFKILQLVFSRPKKHLYWPFFSNNSMFVFFFLSFHAVAAIVLELNNTYMDWSGKRKSRYSSRKSAKYLRNVYIYKKYVWK